MESTNEEEVKCKRGMRAVNGRSHAASVLTFNAKKLLATLSFTYSSIYIVPLSPFNFIAPSQYSLPLLSSPNFSSLFLQDLHLAFKLFDKKPLDQYKTISGFPTNKSQATHGILLSLPLGFRRVFLAMYVSKTSSFIRCISEDNSRGRRLKEREDYLYNYFLPILICFEQMSPTFLFSSSLSS
ncbi:hypothetical protein YC2023_121499 [Brassica napus]